MNKLILFLFTAILLYSCNTDSTSAVRWNDAIIAEQTKILTPMFEFFEMDAAEMQSGVDELVAICDEAIAAVEKLGVWDGNDAFHKAALDLFRFYKKAISVDYREMVEILNKEDLTDERRFQNRRNRGKCCSRGGSI